MFIGCETGAHTSKSLVDAAILAGAHAAMGFKEEVNKNVAEAWIMYFFEEYSTSADVDASIEYACTKAVLNEEVCQPKYKEGTA